MIKERFNSISHGIGALFGLWCLFFLVPWDGSNTNAIIIACVFYVSIFFLYTASALYHGMPLGDIERYRRRDGKVVIRKGLKENIVLQRRLQTLDHCGIFILIAGSYTPICFYALWSSSGLAMLIAVWLVALIGIISKIAFLGYARSKSSIAWLFKPRYAAFLYILMGCMIVVSIDNLYVSLPRAGFVLFFLGGLSYIIGGVIHAIRWPNPFSRPSLKPGVPIHYYGFHEIFHVFIFIGTLIHVYAMYHHVIPGS
ncbi:MAG: hemolysin III family protein [bacterium]|nr:hemolysin III family protein [bacterium]